jgi:hypothetical protein
MLSVVMLNVTYKPPMLCVVVLNVTYKPFMLSVVMLNVVMLNVIMLSVVMLNVVMPFQQNKLVCLQPVACTIKLFTAVIYGFL